MVDRSNDPHVRVLDEWSGVFLITNRMQMACLDRNYADMPSEEDLDRAVKQFKEAVAQCQRVDKRLKEVADER